MKTLQTDRLLLRPWRMEDAEDMFEYACDPRVGPSAGWRPHKRIEDTQMAIRGYIHDARCDARAVVLRETGKVIGGIGLHHRAPRRPRWGRKERELGYVLNPAYWGNDYIPEAAVAVLAHALLEQQVDIVWCGHYDFNDNSRRVIEKCGFEPVFKRQEVLFHLQDRVCWSYYYNIDRRRFLQLHDGQP